MSEIKIAYHNYRVLMIDVADPVGNFRWGIGDRAGLFLAINVLTANTKYFSESERDTKSSSLLPLPPPPPPSLSVKPTQEIRESVASEQVGNDDYFSLILH